METQNIFKTRISLKSRVGQREGYPREDFPVDKTPFAKASSSPSPTQTTKNQPRKTSSSDLLLVQPCRESSPPQIWSRPGHSRKENTQKSTHKIPTPRDSSPTRLNIFPSHTFTAQALTIHSQTTKNLHYTLT